MRLLEVLSPPDDNTFESAIFVLDGVVQHDVVSLGQEALVFDEPGPLPDSIAAVIGTVLVTLTTRDEVVQLGEMNKDVVVRWRRLPTCHVCGGRGYTLALAESER